MPPRVYAVVIPGRNKTAPAGAPFTITRHNNSTALFGSGMYLWACVKFLIAGIGPQEVLYSWDIPFITDFMPKLEDQTRVIAVLRTFTGKLAAAYTSEQEFFLTSLNSMAKYLYDLQRGTLEESCERFLLKVNSGKFTLETVNAFKAEVENLISARDFQAVGGCMSGSKELIKQRLGALKPVSRIAEANKAAGGDADALRHIDEAYARLNFDALAKRLKASPDEPSVNDVLAEAREAVAAYCGLYHVPLTEAETLTPFSLSVIDAVVAASFRLLNITYQAASR